MKSSLIYLVKIFLTMIIVTPVFYWVMEGFWRGAPFNLSSLSWQGMTDEFKVWPILLLPSFLIIGLTEYFLDKNNIPVRERNYTLSMVSVLSIAITFYLRGMDAYMPSFWGTLLPLHYVAIGISSIWLYRKKVSLQ